MKLNILGKNSDDKGRQLEKLTSDLLTNIGCSNIIRNEIGSGGHEIDVRAEYSVPGLNGVNKKPLICECKAYKATITMSDWLKFLGKILLEENNGDIDGYFIALSGANGNVLGNYRELLTKRNNIKLIAGDELIKILSQVYNITNIDSIQKNIEKFTQRKLVEISLYYYNSSIYYLIGFSEYEFTLFSNSGELLEKKEISRIVSLINENTTYQEFINLEDENNAIQRFATIKKFVSSFILVKNKALTINEINKAFQEFNKNVDDLKTEEIEKALNSLIENSIVCKTDNNKFTLLFMNSKKVEDVVTFFRYFVDYIIPLFAIGCEQYNNIIDENLLNKICDIQRGIVIPNENKKDCLKILKWSPSALRWSLEPDKMITSHRSSGKPIFKNADGEDTLYFLQKIITLISEDFKSSSFKEYYFKTCEIVEMESDFSIKLKSNQKVELEIGYNNRIGIGQMTEEYKNQLILMRIFKEQPEPWDRPHIKE